MPVNLPIGNMQVTDTHNAFGFMDQPGFQGTDRISDIGFVNAYDQDCMRYDNVAKCVYAEPIFVPHHNLKTKSDFIGRMGLEQIEGFAEEPRIELPEYPSIHWDTVPGINTDFLSCVLAPLDYTGQKVQLTPGQEHDPAGLSFTATCEDLPDGTRGFYCFKRMSSGSEVSDETRSLYFRFYVSDTRYWQLEYSNPRGLRLTEVNGSTTRQITRMASTQSYSELTGQEKYLAYEHSDVSPVVHIEQTAIVVLLLNKFIQIWVHGQAQPLVISCPNFDEFTKVIVGGSGGRYAYFSVHPMCFAKNAYMVANEKQVGFVRRSSTPIEYDVVSASIPLGCSVEASTALEQGTEFRYKIKISNPSAGTYKGVNYSRKTASATGVTYQIAPHFIRRNDDIGEFIIRSAAITTMFDMHQLNITQKATIVVNNRQGEWREGWPYGPDHTGKGNRAITLNLGWKNQDTGDWTANRRFTGIGGLDMSYSRGTAPESTVTITAEDLSCIPREYPLMNCPWMDGWCHLYAIRYLGWLCGLSDDQMDFEYESDPFCTNPDHYHLPMGEGMNPRMYFPGGTTGWAAMNKIRQLTAHVLYFDINGKLKYYPWVRTSPGPFKRVFYDNNAPGLDPFQAIEQIGFSRSTRSVRTGTLIVGVDAYGPNWDPLIAHRENIEALYDKYSANYKGFRSPMAWADPMFAIQSYAEEAADAVNALVSLPVETVNMLLRLAMSDLYPLDVIGIYDSKMPTNAGVLFKAFFITQTVENFTATKTQKDYSMSLSGRWIV